MCAMGSDVALNVSDSRILFATCTYDGIEEPNKIIDRQRSTYWATSGLYPQQFILTFTKLIGLNSIKIRCYMVRLIQIEKSDAAKPEKFNIVCEKELESTDVEHQVHTLYEGELFAHHLRFTILSGYDHICAVYKIEIDANGKAGKEFKSDDFGKNNKRENDQTISPEQKQISFSSATETEQGFEKTSMLLSSQLNMHENDEDDTYNNYNDDNENNVNLVNDLIPIPIARPTSEIPTSPTQTMLGSSSVLSQKSPHSSLSGISSPEEVMRPLTAQRIGTGRNSIIKKSRLEMFTESEEVSSEEEF